MRSISFCIVFLISLSAIGQSFEERVTDVANVGLTVNNLGMIGNAFYPVEQSTIVLIGPWDEG